MIVDDGNHRRRSKWLDRHRRGTSPRRRWTSGTLIHKIGSRRRRRRGPTSRRGCARTWRSSCPGFLLKYAPSIEYVEVMVYSESRRLWRDPGRHRHHRRERWLIDYKTSDKPIGKSPTMFPYADVALQLAALGFADFIGKPQDPTRYPIPPSTGTASSPSRRTTASSSSTRSRTRSAQTFLHLRNIHEWVKTQERSGEAMTELRVGLRHGPSEGAEAQEAIQRQDKRAPATGTDASRAWAPYRRPYRDMLAYMLTRRLVTTR